jgi:Replication-relaxation
MLHAHRVLTTHQVAALAYTSLRSAQRRPRTLHQHAVLDSFRPLTQTGSAPEHYTLGPPGAAVLAAHTGCDLADLGRRPSHTGRIAYSPSLGHDLGVNELLTHLAAHGRTTPASGLRLWLSERSCIRRWGDLARSDAYAHWRDGEYLLPFFLEYDTGSQPLARVEANLTGYTAFATTAAARPALLIHTRTAPRDQALRRRLAPAVRELGLNLATSSADFPTTEPWGPWWSPLGCGDTHRTTLTSLAARWPGIGPVAELEPTDVDTALTLPVPPLPPASEVGAGAPCSPCQALDQWIARAFAPGRLTGTIEALTHASAAARTAETHTPEHAQARRAIKDCERRLARFQAFLEAGADPAVVTRWINEAQKDKEAARKKLDALPAITRRKESPLDARQSRELTESLGSIAQRIQTVRADKKGPLYEALGITISCENATRTATVRSRPS